MSNDDDKKLPGIDEELAGLDREMKRLAAIPAQTPEQRDALLLALDTFRQDWHAKMKARDDAPEWRRIVDGAMTNALDELILDVQRNPARPGQVSLHPALLQKHLAPVWDLLVAALQKGLVDKFGQKQPPGQPAPKVEAVDLAAMLVTLFGPGKKK